MADWVEICRGGPLLLRAPTTPVVCENRVAGGGLEGDCVVGGEGWRTVFEEKLRFSSSGSKECDRLWVLLLLAAGSAGRSPYFLLSMLGESAFAGFCNAWPCCRRPVGFATGAGAGS